MYPEEFKLVPLKEPKDKIDKCFLESRGML